MKGEINRWETIVFSLDEDLKQTRRNGIGIRENFEAHLAIKSIEFNSRLCVWKSLG